ncbi:MAG: hypothetical protein KGV43_02095 [Arcobacter sp.]|nr:hypothetical protein [Arcobacter sp.]
MKRVIISLIFILNFIYASEVSNDIALFFKIKDNKVLLKWIPKNYSDLNSYKLYKSVNDGKEKLIAQIKVKPIEELKKEGFSEDYIFSIYPFENVKNINEQISAMAAQNTIAGFRILRFMQDNEYAKNIAQYYMDDDVKSLEVYKYRIEQYKAGEFIAKKEFTINKNSRSIDSISWIDAKVDNMGIKLFWDSGAIASFYNVYRKLDNESSFRRLNKNAIYVPPLKKARKRELFLDNSLKENQNASYKVKKLDFFGEEKITSKTVKIKRTIDKKPVLLNNISVYSTDSKKTIQWENRKNILGFNVYRSESYDGKYKKLNKKLIKKTYFIDRDFKVNKNSYYYVTVVDKYGESQASKKVLSYAKDVTPPNSPKNLKFTVKAGEVNLTWDKVKDKDLTGYKVYVSMDRNAKEWALIEKRDIKTNTYIHKKPKTLSRFYYYYKVTAVDKKRNESPRSNIVKVKLPDVTAPKQPAIKSYKTYENKIVFNWQEVYDYDLSHYNLYTQDGVKLIKLNKKPLKVTYFELKNLKYKGLRKYIVTAVDKSGNESSKEKNILIKSLDLTPPKLENIRYSLNNNGLKISFDCNDKDYSGFELFRSTPKSPKYISVSGFKTSKSFINKNLSKNQKYFYYIKAYDKSGNVKVSDVKEILWK